MNKLNKHISEITNKNDILQEKLDSLKVLSLENVDKQQIQKTIYSTKKVVFELLQLFEYIEKY